MARGTFGRTVARAASSGGSKSYRARRPRAWYLLMFVIVVVGVGLIVYSRDEALRVPEGPTATSNWFAALSIDVCGKVEPFLPASTNMASIGLGTVGYGVLNAHPAYAGSGAPAYEGKKATLGLFATEYTNIGTGFRLTNDELRLPGKGHRTWIDGDRCTGPAKGKGDLVARVWSSPTAIVSKTVTTPADIHITNGEMITVAFVPKGTTIPGPVATTVTDLEDLLSGKAMTSTTTSTTTTTTSTLPPTSTTTSTTTSTSTSTSTTTTTTPGKK